jgi:hypothetical protein
MNDKLTALRARIRALMAKTVTNGCTEAEATAASAKVAELMDKFGFEMADLEEREEIVEGNYESIKSAIGPVVYVATAIANFCDVKVWKTTSNVLNNKGSVVRKVSIKYFGRVSDVELAHYMTDIIARAMNNSEKAWAKQIRKTGGAVEFRNCTQFQRGMAARISTRLVTMKEERNHTVHGNNTGYSLVLVKNAEVDEAYNALSIKLKDARRSKKILHTNAFYSGVEAGDKVALNTGINSNKSILAITK